ncbi:hypothetical protein ACGFNU_26610 [Spirillospora sp. NPDC048911]|uniref:hypothetical protein n=1 Tax=Spirillospora sp. NPDC048911 TaxID=3364527 RepID=UPI0037227D98
MLPGSPPRGLLLSGLLPDGLLSGLLSGLLLGVPGVAFAESPRRPAEPAPSAAVPGESAATLAGSRRIMQMNLCNGGYSRCYRGGRAVTSAIAAVTRWKPWAVTLNEICAKDVARIARAGGFGARYTHFPTQRPNGDYVRCKNGQTFGNAVMTKAAAPHTLYKILEQQDPTGEHRSMGCRWTTSITVCTTHLSSRSRPTAREQCDEAMWKGRVFAGSGRMLMIGDLNLRYDKGDVQGCVPQGYARTSDGSVQHAIVSGSAPITGHGHRPLSGTDHPVFWVDVRA